MLPENVGVLGELAHPIDIAANIEFTNATLESNMISVKWDGCITSLLMALPDSVNKNNQGSEKNPGHCI